MTTKRNPNTTRDNKPWSEQKKKDIWKKGSPISGEDSSIWRKDKCGNKMKWSEHGNRNSKYGWEIDHIRPVSEGGDDHNENLQPLYWRNNSNKGDSLNWTCPSPRYTQ